MDGPCFPGNFDDESTPLCPCRLADSSRGDSEVAVLLAEALAQLAKVEEKLEEEGNVCLDSDKTFEFTDTTFLFLRARLNLRSSSDPISATRTTRACPPFCAERAAWSPTLRGNDVINASTVRTLPQSAEEAASLFGRVGDATAMPVAFGRLWGTLWRSAGATRRSQSAARRDSG